jgi:hypothetical protein
MEECVGLLERNLKKSLDQYLFISARGEVDAGNPNSQAERDHGIRPAASLAERGTWNR